MSIRTPVQWKLHGMVKRLATIEPAALHFGSRSRLAPAFDSRTIDVTFHRPINAVNVEVAEPIASVDILEFDSELQKAVLRVTPRVLKSGPFETRVLITGESSENSENFFAEFPVSGDIGNDVISSPTAILHGVVEPETQCEARVSLRSQTGRSFAVDEVTTSSDSVEVKRDIGAAPSGDSVFVISEMTCAIGFHLSTITFHVQCDDGSRERIDVPVRYVGRPQPVKQVD